MRDINKISIDDVKGVLEKMKKLSKDDKDRLINITKILLNIK